MVDDMALTESRPKITAITHLFKTRFQAKPLSGSTWFYGQLYLTELWYIITERFMGDLMHYVLSY
jgi:hypothetical protein